MPTCRALSCDRRDWKPTKTTINGSTGPQLNGPPGRKHGSAAIAAAQRGNPRNAEEARALVKHVKSLFMPWNIDALVQRLHRGLRHPLRHGGGNPRPRRLHEFFTTRSTKQKDYRLRKPFRSLDGDTLGNIWDGESKRCNRRKNEGLRRRNLAIRDGKIAVWEAAFNIARADEAGGVADMLR